MRSYREGSTTVLEEEFDASAVGDNRPERVKITQRKTSDEDFVDDLSHKRNSVAQGTENVGQESKRSQAYRFHRHTNERSPRTQNMTIRRGLPNPQYRHTLK